MGLIFLADFFFRQILGGEKTLPDNLKLVSKIAKALDVSIEELIK